MRIHDFNSAGDPPASGQTGGEVARADGPQDAEVAFLRARIEHLELVVETARGLMTSNQERLLRRLHDLPREMAVLAARVDTNSRDIAWRGN